jgi:putative membrane protein
VKKQESTSNSGKVLVGVASGFVGGLVASWVMDEFQALWNKVAEDLKKKEGRSNVSQIAEQDKEQEPATVKIASEISETLLGHRLTDSEKQIAGPAVHYAFGAVMGALYGAAAELQPSVTTGRGLAFGTAVWAGADESLLYLLGISKAPTEYPLSIHTYALASHFVYGFTADAVRRALKSATGH